MSITKEQIKALTPEHRIVWHSPPGQPVEMGLYVSEHGFLCADTGAFVRHADGFTPLLSLHRIVRIIPPPFVPRVGMVIGRPGDPSRRLVRVDDNDWLGHAPEISNAAHWFTEFDARELVEYHGWEVKGDLSAPGEVTDAEVEAFRAWLDSDLDIPDETIRSGLKAAREARND